MTRADRWRRRLYTTLATYAVLGAIAALDHWYGLPATPHTDAFIGIIIAIVSAIAAGVEAAGAYIAIALQWVVNALWIMVIALSHGLAEGLWLAARWAGRAYDALKVAWDRAIKPFLSWSYRKLNTLELWVKQKLAPVLEFIGKVKARIDELYKTFVRPIIDTIEFIRAVNRVLETFGITLLQKLDEVLAQIERKIEDPLLWVREKITWVENWIDRIVTFDGLFQRLTLLRSLERDVAYRWRSLMFARHKSITGPDVERAKTALRAPSLADIKTATRGSLLGQGGRYAPFVDEWAREWTARIRD